MKEFFVEADPLFDGGEGFASDFLTPQSRTLRKSKIDALDLTSIQRNLVLHKPMGKSLYEQEAWIVIDWYRKFLFLRACYPREEPPLTPIRIVNEVWKLHEGTREYHEECLQIFGEHLHLDRYFGMNNKRVREAAFRRIMQLHWIEFKETWKYPHLLTTEERKWFKDLMRQRRLASKTPHKQ
jgi:hypothetical protein